MNETIVASKSGFLQIRVSTDLQSVRTRQLCTFIAFIIARHKRRGETLYRLRVRSCRIGFEGREAVLDAPEAALRYPRALERALANSVGIGCIIWPGNGQATLRAIRRCTPQEYSAVNSEIDARQRRRLASLN